MEQVLSINRLQTGLFARKRKGFTLVEIMIALAVVIALSVAAFFAFNQVQDMRKVAQVQSDLDALANGCLAYESVSSSQSLPASLADLTTGLTAANTIDGVAHTNFVTTQKASLTDPWGNAYTYSAANRTITCTHTICSGQDATTKTYTKKF